ncbi:MAG TPA: protein phosphatase 2C domain-containing protein [Candidatus Olsenella avicola]|nr:protein phosphatase 2C domain-containing protein [Candidatus Olsenella avicola]
MARSFCITDRGNAANEDFVRVADSYGVVIDGASGLAGAPLFAGRFASNAQWLAHVVGAAVCEALDAGARAEEALEGAVSLARGELETAAGTPLAEMDPLAVPSATLALVVVGDESVELYGLGDSPMAALMRNGSLVVSTDDVLEELDARAVALMSERDPGLALTGPERRRLVDDVVRAHRLLRNTEGGYWSLDPTGAALAHLRRRSLPRDEVASVAGMSDGFWRAFARSGPAAFGVADPAAELARLTPERSRTILVRLRELEASDPDYLRFPRLKRSDDASLFWLEG